MEGSGRFQPGSGERWVGFPVPAPVPARQLISLLLYLVGVLILLRLLGDVPFTSATPAAQRGQARDNDDQRDQYDYASPTKVGCRPALGLCGHLFLVGRRPRLVCCGRRRDGDVGFADSNASRLLHGLSAIRTETTVVRRLVSVIAAIPVRHDPSLRPAASPCTPCYQGKVPRGE